MRALRTAAFLLVFALAPVSTGCLRRVAVEEPILPKSNLPYISRFVAEPEIIHSGEKALLTWSVHNAASVMLEESLEPDGSSSSLLLHSLGEFPASGSFAVHPKSTATYVLSCGKSNEVGLGCASASVSVIVK